MAETLGTTLAHVEAVLAKLQELLPETANSLAPRFEADQVNAWAGVRCAWRDGVADERGDRARDPLRVAEEKRAWD